MTKRNADADAEFLRRPYKRGDPIYVPHRHGGSPDIPAIYLYRSKGLVAAQNDVPRKFPIWMVEPSDVYPRFVRVRTHPRRGTRGVRPHLRRHSTRDRAEMRRRDAEGYFPCGECSERFELDEQAIDHRMRAHRGEH